jgi:hypothetical protein
MSMPQCCLARLVRSVGVTNQIGFHGSRLKNRRMPTWEGPVGADKHLGALESADHIYRTPSITAGMREEQRLGLR